MFNYNRVRFLAGLVLAVTLFTAIFALSLKSRQPSRDVEKISLSTITHQSSEVTDATAIERDEFGPESLPVAQEITDDAEIEFPSRKSFLSIDLALLDSLDFADVRDVRLYDGRALLATAGGVIEFYADDSSFAIYSYPQGLTDFGSYAILAVGTDIYVGTSCGVYQINPIAVVTRVWTNITDTVVALRQYDNSIYVGTRRCGLYVVTGDTVDQILSDRSVVAVTKNHDGVWVATREDGLLYNDGNGWRKRYLKRDSLAFAGTTSLEKAYGQPWVGTPEGVYFYNGGAWTLIDSTAGLFDQAVTAISMGRKFVYIGTANSGVFAYYDGGLSPLDWSEALPVSSLDVDNGSYLVGIQRGGAILKTSKGEYNILDVIRQTETIYSSLASR